MANIEDMLESLQSMGIDPTRFSKQQLETVMKVAEKIQDPTQVTQENIKEIASVLAPKKADYGKTPVNSPCPCGSGKKYKKCCRN